MFAFLFVIVFVFVFLFASNFFFIVSPRNANILPSSLTPCTAGNTVSLLVQCHCWYSVAEAPFPPSKRWDCICIILVSYLNLYSQSICIFINSLHYRSDIPQTKGWYCIFMKHVCAIFFHFTFGDFFQFVRILEASQAGSEASLTR